MLDEYNLDRVYAWGHPDGLEGGKSEKAYEEMVASFEYAQQIGAKVMRVVLTLKGFKLKLNKLTSYKWIYF